MPCHFSATKGQGQRGVQAFYIDPLKPQLLSIFPHVHPINRSPHLYFAVLRASALHWDSAD